MVKNKEFKQKIEADLALLESELARFKLRGMGFTAEAKDKHDEHVEALEEMIDAINDTLSTFDKSAGYLGEDLREDVEKSWRELQAALQDAIETFKTEPGVEEAHGGDEGPFPYGDGLSGRSAGKQYIKTGACIMGDKGGKKDKAKSQRQSQEKQEQKQGKKLEKQPKVSPIPETNR